MWGSIKGGSEGRIRVGRRSRRVPGGEEATDRRRIGGWQHPSTVWKEPGSRSLYEGIAYASSRDAGVRATIIHVNHIISYNNNII